MLIILPFFFCTRARQREKQDDSFFLSFSRNVDCFGHVYDESPAVAILSRLLRPDPKSKTRPTSPDSDCHISQGRVWRSGFLAQCVLVYICIEQGKSSPLSLSVCVCVLSYAAAREDEPRVTSVLRFNVGFLGAYIIYTCVIHARLCLFSIFTLTARIPLIFFL